MKKVLSVLLAAAMVMGMSVTSFAKVWGDPVGAGESYLTADQLYFNEEMYVVHEDGETDSYNCVSDEDSHTIIAGDKLYFTIEEKVNVADWVVVEEFVTEEAEKAAYDWLKANVAKPTVGQVANFHASNGTYNEKGSASMKYVADAYTAKVPYTGEIDADWVINMKDVDYVSKAYFTADDVKVDVVGDFDTADIDEVGNVKYVAVEVDADYDAIDEDDIDFYFYIAQKDEKTHNTKKSEMVAVHYVFDNWDKVDNTEFKVDYKFTNEVDVASKWISPSKGTATFSFNDEAFFEVKMITDEEVVLNAEIKSYVKEIEKAFDYEAEYVSYNFKGTKDAFYREGVLVLPADEDTFIYAWDGEFAEIEAEYVKDYKFDNGLKVDGWKINTNELGWYVVSDLEAEIEVEAEEPATEVEAEKANPETGAADFVGAAVAMAVVSVAAAGALALKK